MTKGKDKKAKQIKRQIKIYFNEGWKVASDAEDV